MSDRPAPEPRVERRRITLPDGRPLIYYTFVYPRDPRPEERRV